MKRQSDMNPLLKIAVPLILGIVTSMAIGTETDARLWLSATIASLTLALALYRHKIAQSLALYLIIYMLGGFLTSQRLAATHYELPDAAVSYKAVIASQPIETEKSIRCDIIIIDALRPVKLKAAFHKDSASKTLQAGDGFSAKSKLRKPENKPNASFDYAEYLRLHDYAGTTFISGWNWKKKTISLKKLSRTERARLSATRLRARLLQEYAEAGIEASNYQIIAAMTLGEKSSLAKETKDRFSISGASHILALSGLHLSIIYAILSILMGRKHRSFVGQTFLMISIWAFVFIVGMPTSAVRAAIMLTACSFTTLLNRDNISLNTLALATITILLADPFALYDTGFQLSFMSVLFILLLYPKLSQIFPMLQRNTVTKYLWQITAVSIAAQIGTLPLVAMYFGRIPCYSLISNILVVPAAFLIICGSILTLTLSPLPSLQHPVAAGVSELTQMLSDSLELLSSLPYSSIDIPLSVIQTIMCYLIIFSAYWIVQKIR